MRWSNTGNSIVDIVKEEFNLDIPVDPDDEDILVKYLFSEKNSNRLNKIINHLLDLGDKDITDCIWRYFPLNVGGYHFEGPLKDMAEKRVKVIEEFFQNGGNLYNKTESITFSKGILMPLGDSHRNKLKQIIEEEASDENLPPKEQQEISSFSDELSGSNKSEGRQPSFVILDNDENIVGHICISLGAYFSLRSSKDTYNLSFYTVPGYRGKGFMKAALQALIKAASEKKILILEQNPVIEYDAEVTELPIRLLNAIIYKENIASIKTIQAVGNFEDMGCVKLVRNDNEIDECRIFTLVL